MNLEKEVIKTFTFFFQELQNTDIGIYGVDIPLQAQNLIIEIQAGSNINKLDSDESFRQRLQLFLL